MKQLYIIGNSGFAKEVFELTLSLSNYNFCGFIDYKPTGKSVEIAGKIYDVFDEDFFLNNIEPTSNICLAIGVGDPTTIRNIAKKFSSFCFPNLLHPNSIVNMDVNTIGKGNIITANVVFTIDITVGDFNIFNLSATVGHDTTIGNYNVINPAVNISGGVSIGDCNLLGVGSTILQYKSIGNQSTVGASSLVTKNVADNQVVVGVPAKNIKNE